MLPTLDRTLPVPLGAQLRGLIEYGIACGNLVPGTRLPSVRELAEEVGVAPMTVSQVYRHLKAAGLIETRAGSGTFVARGELAHARDPSRTAALYRKVDALISEGLQMGLRSVDIAGLVGARLSSRHMRGRTQNILLVGVFEAATADYARTVREILGPIATVEPVTIDALICDETARLAAAKADLVLTMAHRQREVGSLLPTNRILAIRFIPSEATRRALASLDPRASVLCVSRFPEFLPVLKSGVQRFAPHVSAVAGTVVDAPGLAAQIAQHTMIVYASGAEMALDFVPDRSTAVEYRHMPDPGDIERLVRPLIEVADFSAFPEAKAS